jgi:hypothetical protein
MVYGFVFLICCFSLIEEMTKDIRGESNARDYQTKMIPWHMLKLDEAESVRNELFCLFV